MPARMMERANGASAFLERHPSVHGGFDGSSPIGNQEHLCQGNGGDREDEHGAEPDDDGEPSLGWGLNGEKDNASGHDWELDNCDRESDEPLLTNAVEAWHEPDRKVGFPLQQGNGHSGSHPFEDFGTQLVILLAQPGADTAIQQMHRVAGLIVCHARAMQARR